MTEFNRFFFLCRRSLPSPPGTTEELSHNQRPRTPVTATPLKSFLFFSLPRGEKGELSWTISGPSFQLQERADALLWSKTAELKQLKTLPKLLLGSLPFRPSPELLVFTCSHSITAVCILKVCDKTDLNMRLNYGRLDYYWHSTTGLCSKMTAFFILLLFKWLIIVCGQGPQLYFDQAFLYIIEQAGMLWVVSSHPQFG